MENNNWLMEGKEVKITEVREGKKKVLERLENSLIKIRNMTMTTVEYSQLPDKFLHEMELVTKAHYYISTIIQKDTNSKRTELIPYDSAARLQTNPLGNTLEDILTYGILDNGMDKTKLLRGMLIGLKVSTSYIMAFKKRPEKRDEHKVFTLLRVYNEEGNSLIIDPSRQTFRKYASEKKSPYIIFAEGLDNDSLGIRTYKDLDRIKDSVMKKYNMQKRH